MKTAKVKRMVELTTCAERDRILRYYDNCDDDMTKDDILEDITYGLLEGEPNLVSEWFARNGGYPSLPRCTMSNENVNAFYSHLDYQIMRITNL